MAVCNFYLRGQCKFGDKCRNEHPPNRGPGFGNQSWNSNNNNVTLPFTADTMTSDLTPQSDKPLWPLSSYGAAKHEPTLLKDLDESPEELRVRAVAAIQAGNVNEYMTYENNKIAAAETVYSNARGNIKEAFEQAAKQSSLSALFATQSTGANTSSAAFGGGSSSTPSAFGQPAFGQSTFGQQATSTCLLLHKPSAFGQSTTTTPSAFGQPTQPAPAFGQTTQPTSVFGQAPQAPSAFGQPQQPSAFGQTSQPSSLIKPATGAFGGLTGSGTTNAFGGGGFSAFSGQPSAFGAGATPTTTAPVPQAGGSVFGQSAFGAAAAPSTTTAQTSVFAPATTSAFGAPSAFGALAPQQPVSAFGGSAFGSQTQTQPVSAFNTQTNNSFANLANAATSAFAGSTSAFGGGSSAASLDAPKVASAFSAQPLSAFPMSSPSSSSSFPAASSNANNGKGRSVVGPPDFASAKSCYQPGATPYDQQLPPNYMGAVLPPSVLDAFKAQKFEWGKIPEWVPPLELR